MFLNTQDQVWEIFALFFCVVCHLAKSCSRVGTGLVVRTQVKVSIQVDDSQLFIWLQGGFEAQVVTISRFMPSTEDDWLNIQLQHPFDSQREALLQIFKRTIGAIDISDIKNCDVGAPVPRKFSELGSNSIRTFDSTDATVIDIYSFIAFKTQDSKGDFFKRSQAFIV